LLTNEIIAKLNIVGKVYKYCLVTPYRAIIWIRSIVKIYFYSTSPTIYSKKKAPFPS